MTTILIVCTGNICRSPAAAIALQDRLDGLAQLSSAGVHALVGEGMPVEMRSALAMHGIDGSGHRARQLASAEVQSAELIVAMSAEHRRRIVAENPAALKRSFLFMELVAAANDQAPLAGSTPAERLAHVGRAIQAHRPYWAGTPIPDVPDPYRRSQRTYNQVTSMIIDGARDIAAWIHG